MINKCIYLLQIRLYLDITHVNVVNAFKAIKQKVTKQPHTKSMVCIANSDGYSSYTVFNPK